MSKSKVVKFFLGIIIAVLLVSGCSTADGTEQSASVVVSEKASSESTSAEAASSMQPVNLVFASMGTGTGNYAQASLLANLFLDYLPDGSNLEVQPISPGGYTSAYLFQVGQADLTFCNTAPAKLAYEEGLMDKPPVTNIRALVGVFSEAATVVVFRKAYLEENNINTFKDVLDQKLPIRIGTGTIGTLDEYCLRCNLAAYGYTYDDVASWGGEVMLTSGDQKFSMLKDGQIDVAFEHTSSSSSQMAEVALTCDLVFDSYDEAFLEEMEELGFASCTIPANTWRNQVNDIDSFGAPDFLCCDASLDDEIAYTLVKAMCENRDFLVKNFASFYPLDPETTWENVGGLPLHPGAERYYKEVGYMPAS